MSRYNKVKGTRPSPFLFNTWIRGIMRIFWILRFFKVPEYRSEDNQMFFTGVLTLEVPSVHRSGSRDGDDN